MNLPIKNKNSTIGTIEMYDGVLCLLRSLVRLVVDVFAADLPNMVVCFAKLPKLLGSMSQLFYKILQIRYLTFTICYSLLEHLEKASFRATHLASVHLVVQSPAKDREREETLQQQNLTALNYCVKLH